MLKKVAVSRLKAGMFVADLNAGWMGHPFIRNQLRLDAEDVLLLQESGIREVTIDTERGLDAEGPSLAVFEREKDEQLRALAQQAEAAPAPGPGKADLGRARLAMRHAVAAVRQVMQDVRIGKPVEPQLFAAVAREVALEVIANPATTLAVFHLQRNCEYTYAHSLRVATLCVSCAHRMGLSAAMCQDLALGGLLHDLGKMRLRREVLEKPERLTSAEMAHAREHVQLGASLLAETPLPEAALAVLLEHHERYDGNGYPAGRAGKEISLAGRIAALADVYDAIASDRWYQKALPPAAAIRKIHEWSQHHFDPEVAAHFIRAIGIYPVGSLVRLSNRRLALVVQHQQHSPLHPRVRPIFDLQQRRFLENAAELDLFERRSIQIEAHEDPRAWGIDPANHL